MKLIAILALLVFLTADCSQTKSQSNDSNKLAIQIATNSNTGPQLTESKQPEVDTVKEWNSKVGVNDFAWDGKDLTMSLGKEKKIEIFSEFAKSDYRFLKKFENTKGCSTNYYYRPLAIAGNLVSFNYESGFLCGAINTVEWGYSTFELARDGRFLFYHPNAKGPVSTKDPTGIALSDIFAENDVFTALMADERISSDIEKLVGQGKIDKAPENLAELSKLVDRFQDDFLGGEFYWNFDQFAIHHLENGKANVWISLLRQAPPARALREHLEISLPIPEKIKQSLLLADSHEEGFLMKDANEMVGTGYATFEFGKRAE